MKYIIPRIRFFSSDPDKNLNAELVKAGIATTGLGAAVGAGFGRWGKKSSGIKKKAAEEIAPLLESQSALREAAENKIKEINNLPKLKREALESERQRILATAKDGKFRNLTDDQKKIVTEIEDKLNSGKIGAPSKETLEKKIKEVKEDLAENLKSKKSEISKITKKSSKAIRKNTLKGAGKGALYTGLGAAALGYGIKKLTD